MNRMNLAQRTTICLLVLSLIGITISVSTSQAAVADFNGDLKSDILWQQTSGTVAIWLMNGTAVSSVGVSGTVASDWQIKGVGDFNGDGRADVLWQQTSGTVAIWLMNGTAISSVGVSGTVASDWQIKGVGDFNGDDRADVLWQQTSGTVAIWLMNGTAISSVGVSGTVASDWQIKGVGDFNGDDRADVLWQQTSGTVAIWLMNGTAIASTGVTGAITSDWQIKGIGDYNANLRADILWQQTSGTVAIWLMNGTAISSVGVSGTVAGDWQIKPGPQSIPAPAIPILTGPSTATTGNAFTLTWTYTFGGLASTQEGYELQESTNASFSTSTTIFNSLNQGDRVSPKSYSVTKNAAGTFYYRVRAYDYPGGLTGWSNTLTVTVQQAPTQTRTYNSSVDATLVWCDCDANMANTNYGSGVLGVGNYYLVGAWIDTYMRNIMFVYFNTGSELQGKTILSANLRLTPYSLAVQKDGRYRVFPIATTWNGGTVTWNNSPTHYLSPYAEAYAPISGSEITSWDVTSIIRDWVNGTRVNYGFWVEDMTPPSIYSTDNQITYYISCDSGEASAYWPKLVVTFQ